jgi:hypothetical protein
MWRIRTAEKGDRETKIGTIAICVGIADIMTFVKLSQIAGT